MTPAPRALIVGSGVGGLAAAVALGRAGCRVRVYERAAEPRTTGFALMLAPNAMAALRELGLATAVADAGVPVGSVELRRTDGRVLRRFPGAVAADGSNGSVFVLRAALADALLSAVEPGTVALGQEVTSCESRADAVRVGLADGSVEEADIMVGADGVGSIVRMRLHRNEPAPRPSGYCALRGIAYNVEGHLGDLSAVGYFGPGIEAATARASGNAVYWYLSMLTADVVGTSADLPRMLAMRTAGFDAAFRAISQATTPENMRFDELYVRPPLAQWGGGRVTLLGDAAHPLLPHTGQGAAQALEDAVALGLALQQTGDARAALRVYERIRGSRTRRFVAMGPRIARITTTRNQAIAAVRDTAIRMVPASLLSLAARIEARDPHRPLRGRSSSASAVRQADDGTAAGL